MLRAHLCNSSLRTSTEVHQGARLRVAEHRDIVGGGCEASRSEERFVGAIRRGEGERRDDALQAVLALFGWRGWYSHALAWSGEIEYLDCIFKAAV